MTSLHAAVAEIHDGIFHLRHDIHRFPEPGFEETRTQARIRKELEGVGLAPRACAKTGLVVDIGAGQGPLIALRADIDCLRMTEENPHLPYRSERDGYAHMCGHDGHTAVLVGAGKILAKLAHRLPGRVRLIFQPAEEGPGGAPVMIEEGALDGVDEIYGMHNWPNAPLGSLRTLTGPMMATVAELSIEVKGIGGHASQPQVAVDPVLAAAHIVTALQSIVSRNVHYEERAVISVTMIKGGEAFNVIPDGVKLGGTIRALSEEVYQLIDQRIRQIATQTAQALGATAKVVIDRMYPVVVNTPEETRHVMDVGRAMLGAENVSSDLLPMLGAEDFSYFLEEKPGCFFFLGGAEEGRTNAICHSTAYDFNDRLLSPAIEFWIRLIEHRFGTKLLD